MNSLQVVVSRIILLYFELYWVHTILSKKKKKKTDTNKRGELRRERNRNQADIIINIIIYD